MIFSLDELQKIPKLKDVDAETLVRKEAALESAIRAHTRNNFQNRAKRFSARSDGNTLDGYSPYIKPDDTIEISQSINNGLHLITDVIDGVTSVDSELFPANSNLVTKVEYPLDVKEGVIDLLVWETTQKRDDNVKRESLSRHTVEYVDSTTTLNRYPAHMMNFLKPYMRANI